jgi:hypothetical protein
MRAQCEGGHTYVWVEVQITGMPVVARARVLPASLEKRGGHPVRNHKE